MKIKIEKNKGKQHVNEVMGISDKRAAELEKIIEVASNADTKSGTLQGIADMCVNAHELVWASWMYGERLAVQNHARRFAERMTERLFGGASTNALFWACLEAIVTIVFMIGLVMSIKDFRSDWWVAIIQVVVLASIFWRRRKV